MTEEEFANYFSQFGHVLDATLMLDRASGRPRGFGFITFESDRGVDAALSRRDLMLHDKPVSSRKVILRWIFLGVLDASTPSFLYLTWLIVTHAWFC